MKRSARLSRCSLLWLLFFLLLPGGSIGGEVVRVVIDRREELLGGREWGRVGAYEKLVGRIYFLFDPKNEANTRIVDLEWAPRNSDGLVEVWADFVLLQPKNPSGRREVAWVEVAGQGRMASLRLFNRAVRGASDPETEADFGDGLLLEQGLTLIWVGWQWDIPERPDFLNIGVPRASLPNSAIEGLVRAEWLVAEETETLSLGSPLREAYLPAAPDRDADMLTVRDGPEAPKEVVPRQEWTFVSERSGPSPGRLGSIFLEGGFQAGKLYELVYKARGPRVAGLGLAVVRDVISYAKYDLDSEFPVNLGIAFGTSQAGQFLRDFLYEGFNTDEKGRRAFDGMLIHAAGAGRGNFNHRFAQPSLDGETHPRALGAAELFPFTSRAQRDPLSGREDGLFGRTPADHLPRVIYTNTGYDYWERAASLIHTSLDGRQDVEPRENERIYALASAQPLLPGSPGPDTASTTSEGIAARSGNALDLTFTLRALAMKVLAWVEDGTEPPASVFPRVGDGTLVPATGLAFPELPGVSAPTSIHEAHRIDYGPRWWSEGIIDREPPKLGPAFPSLVSQVDGLGNEIGGVRSWELRVPLATYVPWIPTSVPEAQVAEPPTCPGAFIPLPLTEEGRAGADDPRPSVEGLYATKEDYLERVRGAVRELVREGFLLPQDAAVATGLADARWSQIVGGEPGPE